LAQQAQLSVAMDSTASTIMLAHHDLIKGLELPNTLTPSHTHTSLAVGHFLRKLYSDMPAEDVPQRLQALIAKLEAAGRETRPGLR
jgi:hypothetical protein